MIKVNSFDSFFCSAVLALTERRVSATLVRELVKEITLPQELKKWRIARRDPLSFLIGQREKGMGRLAECHNPADSASHLHGEM